MNCFLVDDNFVAVQFPTVMMRIPPSLLHLFDVSTGKAASYGTDLSRQEVLDLLIGLETPIPLRLLSITPSLQRAVKFSTSMGLCEADETRSGVSKKQMHAIEEEVPVRILKHGRNPPDGSFRKITNKETRTVIVDERAAKSSTGGLKMKEAADRRRALCDFTGPSPAGSLSGHSVRQSLS